MGMIDDKGAGEIADAFLAAGQRVYKYLHDNYGKITHGKYESLDDSFKTIMRASTFATTEAVGLAIDAMADPVIEIKNVIDTAKEKIEELKTIDNVIKLAADLADLASGIIAKDPNAIGNAVKNLIDQIKPIKSN